jgi:hypothetical protein
MVNCNERRLDRAFAALKDGTRRLDLLHHAGLAAYSEDKNTEAGKKGR